MSGPPSGGRRAFTLFPMQPHFDRPPQPALPRSPGLGLCPRTASATARQRADFIRSHLPVGVLVQSLQHGGRCCDLGRRQRAVFISVEEAEQHAWLPASAAPASSSLTAPGTTSAAATEAARTEFLVGELAVVVLVELQQLGVGLRYFRLRENAVRIGVKDDRDRRRELLRPIAMRSAGATAPTRLSVDG